MSQKEQILRHLIRGKSITPLEALHRYGCFRLGARIWEIKKDGYPVKQHIITTATGKRVARYEMEGVK